jgi:nucleotide-binding universal stress UspA family protein
MKCWSYRRPDHSKGFVASLGLAESTGMRSHHDSGPGRSNLDEMRNIQDKLAVEYRGWLDKAKEMFAAKGIKVATILEVGQVPANNIIRRVEDDKFDRVIMGATGRSGLARILMGSTGQSHNNRYNKKIWRYRTMQNL